MPSNAADSTAANPTPVSKAPRALKAALILSALFLLSRLTGLFQIIIIGAILEPREASAYVAAFKLPDYLNYLVASGAMSLTFIPIFTRFWTRGEEDEAWQFFSTLATLLGALLLVLTIVFLALAQPMVMWTNKGWDAPEKAAMVELTTQMTRLMLPAQIFFFLGGLLTATLNSFKRFAVTGWTGAVYNLTAIVVAIPLYYASKNPLVFALAITIGAFVGSFLMPLIALLRGPKEERPDFFLSFDWKLDSVQRYFRLAMPIMLSFSVATADVWVWQYFAAGLGDDALRNLNAAYRLMISAQGVLGQAAAVAAFPFLASQFAAGQVRPFAEFLRTGLRRLLFLSLPISLLLVLGAVPLCTLVFAHGEFSTGAARGQTATAFAWFVAGLFAWATQGLVARGFYAMGDTKTPNIVGTIISLGLLAPLCWGSLRLGWNGAGLAFSTTFSIVVYLAVLLVLLEKKLQREHGAAIGLGKIAGTMLRTVCACALAGLAGFLALKLAAPVIAHDKVGDVGLLLWVWGVTGFVFVSSASRFAIPEWFWVRDKITRRSKK